jgi:hypothetical protein
MPGHKREAQDQLSKPIKESEMELEFEDPWDDEFSDASLQTEEMQDNDLNEMNEEEEADHKGIPIYLNV